MKWSSTQQDVAWIVREDTQGTILLRPPYQRRPVWDDGEASYLIDTILSGLPFPEVYIKTSVSEDGATRHDVVDGQQRITSMLRFARDELRLESDDDTIDPRWQSKIFSELEPEQRKTFFEYIVVVRRLTTETELELRDMFRRLNVNQKTLNDQELRHARFKGAFIQLMERLAEDPWWTDMRIVTPKEVRRQLDVEFVSELTAGIMSGPLDKKKRLDEDFYEAYESDFPEGPQWEESFLKVRDTIGLTLAQDVRKWSGRSDFYGLFLAFNSLIEDGVTFNANQRRAAARALAEFRTKVDQAKRKGQTARYSQTIQNYVDALTRAATDASRRELRIRTIEQILEKAVRATA